MTKSINQGTLASAGEKITPGHTRSEARASETPALPREAERNSPLEIEAGWGNVSATGLGNLVGKL